MRIIMIFFSFVLAFMQRDTVGAESLFFTKVKEGMFFLCCHCLQTARNFSERLSEARQETRKNNDIYNQECDRNSFK